MRQISKDRFNALAGYARHPIAALVTQEFGWFEVAERKLVAAVFVDRDEEYNAVIMARDLQERFRAVQVLGSFETPEEVVRYLRPALAKIAEDLEEVRAQGDEDRPIDFFMPVVASEKIARGFDALTQQAGFSAARGLIGEMMRWHDDADGNYVEQFQTTGFDARLWELYLYATLVEAGFAVQRPSPAPDYIGQGLAGALAIEGTTVNPTRNPDGSEAPSQRPANEEDVTNYLRNYLPIKYAGPLTAKLAKRDWLHPAVAGMPFIIAIQDFHDVMSMTFSGGALRMYLYGIEQVSLAAPDGTASVEIREIVEHRWGSKTVASGFFALPDADNVSAVLFNASATLSKFNRMGVKVGFGSEDVVLLQHVTYVDSRPSAQRPLTAVRVVGEGHPETWIEGTDVYHNPNARVPLDPELLPEAAHHFLDGGRVRSVLPEFHPISSRTSILTFAPTQEA